jgi:hypothetical protein
MLQKTIFRLLIIMALAGFSVDAEARPVSYPGGLTVMTMNNGDSHSFHLHYSPTAKYSLGYRLEYWREGDFTLETVQLNNLLKRWNNPDSQANLYLKSGLGVAYSDHGDFDHELDPAYFTGIAADWENRRYFVSYENRYVQGGDIADFYMQNARVGVAPYTGDYGDLHTWLMLQAEHTPEAEETWTVTPLVRFFKGVHLVEAGMSQHGDVMANWVIRF